MNKLPLVSILIPTYNRAGYLSMAIDSALAQTYPHCEIIVHDDASTDDTPQVLHKYHGIPHLKIIRTESNHGMLGGWNYIQQKAKGKYIKFLASDDFLEPDSVQVLVTAAEANPHASLITCRRRFVNEKGKLVKRMQFAGRDKAVKGRDHAHWILTTLRENKIGEPTAVLYPRTLISLAGEYDPQFSSFADFEYWIRLLEFGDLVYVHQSLCSFRIHEGSVSSAGVRDGRFITEIFALIAKFYNHPRYLKSFALTADDRKLVTRTKTLDILKNIKDLFVDGQIKMARDYFRRLSRAVRLDDMTRATLSYILK